MVPGESQIALAVVYQSNKTFIASQGTNTRFFDRIFAVASSSNLGSGCVFVPGETSNRAPREISSGHRCETENASSFQHREARNLPNRPPHSSLVKGPYYGYISVFTLFDDAIQGC